MQLWPWRVNNKKCDVIVAFTALAVSFILAILRLISVSRKSIRRDLVMLGLHIASALSVVGFILLHAEFNPSDVEFCRMSNCFQWTGEYLRRLFALCVYWLRLSAFIGPIYPNSVGYFTLLPIILYVIFLCVSLLLNLQLSSDKGAHISKDGVCGVLRSDSSVLVLDTCVILTMGLTSMAYLTLFILPLLKYNKDNVLNKTMRKHVVITSVDIILELLVMAIILSDEHMQFSTYWKAQFYMYFGLICSNVMLIFVFADWRKYLCITDKCIKRKGDYCGETIGRMDNPSLQTRTLEERLVP